MKAVPDIPFGNESVLFAGKSSIPSIISVNTAICPAVKALQSKIEMSKRSVNTIQSIAVLSVVLLSFQRETMQNFAVTVADKKHTVKRISGKGTKCSLTS